eukprot:TRINITY_DN6549_c0_g1_i1.p1 TRINITY_DN6549_c0_g1~~TRINITY_DN6549_c0_g1_i1.p1  ORF type:complete len:310 (-),score=61.71 TRINITY_DN6549_c0_g1_i1:148-1077(-)
MSEEVVAAETEPEAVSQEEEIKLTWDELKTRVDVEDMRAQLFLLEFEDRYGIESAIDAFTNIKTFLGVHLIQKFDYRQFCEDLGGYEPPKEGEEDCWDSYVAEHLNADFSFAVSLMLRLTVMIAKEFRLHKSDWKDINDACSAAVRILPACYRLQRILPSALDDARALRQIPPAESSELQELNPWHSNEGKELFERRHGVEWSHMEALTSEDGPVRCCFTAALQVIETKRIDDVAMVRLRALHTSDAPSTSVPSKALSEGDTVLWEVEEASSLLLEPGFVIQGDWFEVQREIVFMTALTSVGPLWSITD